MAVENHVTGGWAGKPHPQSLTFTIATVYDKLWDINLIAQRNAAETFEVAFESPGKQRDRKFGSFEVIQFT